MKTQRNDPCPCGSGKKYKHCCENKVGLMSRHKSLVLVGAVVVIGCCVWIGNEFFFGSDAGQGSLSQLPGAAPPGEAPPGKVWSSEHGHYHDVASGQPLPGSGQVSTPPPAGGAPGVGTVQVKVWSPEHGHWHDSVTGQALPDSLQTGPPEPATP